MSTRVKSIPAIFPARPLNRLLAGLPSEDFERLRPHLTPLSIARKQTFHRRGEPVRQVFFLNGGVASVTSTMRDGRMVEVATVGAEGMVGINAYLGGRLGAGASMLQIPDSTAYAMPLAAFRAEIDRRGALDEAVGRYAEGFLGSIMQSTACIALHTVQERCCRWLLMAHDRVRGDQFRLSHEFMAMMLGSTRPTVSIVAGALQQAGLIRYTHGRITVLDRPALEAAACECYGTIREDFERLGLLDRADRLHSPAAEV